MSNFDNVMIPKVLLGKLIDMAQAHTQDIESGIEDGTYTAAENQDIDVKTAAVEAAQKIFASDLPPRVLVFVRGGIAESVWDDGIDVEIFDWDNYQDDPDNTDGVPTSFADLADPLNTPVQESPASDN